MSCDIERTATGWINDGLMDAVTDAGKGAYFYVDSEEGDWPIIKWSAGDDYIVGPTSGAAFRANSYNDWNYEGVSDQGLLFTFDNNVLTVASEYGVITAKNIKNILAIFIYINYNLNLKGIPVYGRNNTIDVLFSTNYCIL